MSMEEGMSRAILRNKKKVDLKEVQIGRRVVVDIGNGEGPLKAGEIADPCS